MGRHREFEAEEVLDSAIFLFWRHGYNATSIRDLEKQTGLAAGSLYKAFGNKRELFRACMAQYMEKHSYKALLLRVFDKPVVEGFRLMFDTIVETTSGERPGGCLATTLIPELFPVEPELAAEASEGLTKMEKAIRLRLQWAKETGELADSSDVDALASFIMALVQGLLVMSTSTRDRDSMLRAARTGLDVLERAGQGVSSPAA